jgi:hypothetical protein
VEHQSFFQDKLAGLSPHLPQIYSVYRLIAFEVRTFFVIFPCDSYLMVRNLWPSTRIFCFNNKVILSAIYDSPYCVFVALWIVLIVVSLIFNMAYFLSWPVQELLKIAKVRCAIANNKIFVKTFNIFIRGRYFYQWYHYNHNAKRYRNVIRGII